MSARAIAVLGVIAAALFAYVVAFERTSVTSKELADRAGRVLPSFVRDKVERITLQRRGVEVVLARKREADGLGALELLAPIKSAADSEAGDRLLGELEWLSARRTVEDNGQLGLDKPRFRVSYVAGGASHVLVVGNDDVHGQGLYVRVDQDPRVYVVPRTFLEVIDHEPGYFRDKSLFPELTVAWANVLAVRNGSLVHELKKEDKHWWLEGKRYADETKIDAMLQALASLRASREVEPRDEAAAKEALAHVTLRVDVSVVPDEHREDKKPVALALEVAGACGKDARYARVGTRLVCIPATELAPFELGAAELIEPRLFRAPPNEITRFVITRGKEQLAWRREGTKWKSDVDAPADTAAIESWIRELREARAMRTKSPAGFAEQGKLRLELVGDQVEELAYGALVDEAMPVQRAGESVLVLFPASVHDRLAPLRERFQPLALWRGHQPSDVVSFEAQVGARHRRGTLVDGAWQSDAGSDQVRELVRALVASEGLAYLGETSRAEHGIGTGKLVLGLKDGKALTLELGAATSRGVYARRGRDIVELSSGTLALIDELAGGPRASHADEEDEDDEHEH
ncbi:MAG TPA: DUF4340 domain-containing protein [Polyangiales bacterium]|nr:DUF4340 domain-containing protein [Polyangiales bacterium]